MKIAFFDIDGTLVNVPNGLFHPTSETIRVLKEFKSQGNKIVIATARGAVPDSVKDIDFDGYICNDGHYIIFDNETILDEQFSKQQLDKQMQVYEKYNGKYMFDGHNGHWCKHVNEDLVVQHRLTFQGTKEPLAGTITDFTSDDVKAISCCVLFNNKEDLMNAYHELEDEFTMIPYDTGLIRMDVYCKGFTKGKACDFLYKKLNIDYDNTYAFGDGVNDKEMIELVKYGIAMGNAVDSLKEIAYDITDTVDNDGIAKAFKKYLNI